MIKINKVISFIKVLIINNNDINNKLFKFSKIYNK